MKAISPLICTFLLAAGPGAGVALAADRVWNGNGGDNLWSTSGNWNVLPVTNGSDGLFFNGSNGLNAENDFAAGSTFNKITFQIGASAFTLSGNSIKLGGTISNLSSETQTIALNMELTGERTISTSAGMVSVSGNMSGSYMLNKTGSGILTLTGSNSFTNLSAASNGGTIRVGHANATGNGYVLLRNNTTIEFVSGIKAATFHGLGYDGGTASVADFALTNNLGQAVALTIRGSGNNQHSGTLSGAGSLIVALEEGGRQRLSGGQTYTGGTTIESGVLELSGASGNLASTGAVTVNGGTLEISRSNTSKTLTIASLNGTGGTITSNVGTGTATLAVNTVTHDRYEGDIAQGSSASFRLTKSGTGSLTLAGNAAYNGVTTVTGGLLRIDGTLQGSNVTVSSGAALGGHGGTITDGNITLASGSSLAFLLDDPEVTGLTVGALALGSNINLTLELGAAVDVGDRFTLLDGYTGGTFATLNGTEWTPDGSFTLSYQGNDYLFQIGYDPGTVWVQVVPEPGCTLLLLAGTGGMVLWLRRRSS